MLTSIKAAENVLGANHDIWQLNEEQEYFEEFSIDRQILSRSFARIDKLGFATATGSISGLIFFLTTSPCSTRELSRLVRMVGEIRLRPRCISLKRVAPTNSSRMISMVHFSPMISVALAIGQNCPYSIVVPTGQVVCGRLQAL